MDGVSILQTYTSLNPWSIFCIIAIIILMIVYLCTFKNTKFKQKIILLACIITLVCASITIGKLASDTIYKVTVDDSVSFNNFMEKYEIQNVQGKIYEVIEK